MSPASVSRSLSGLFICCCVAPKESLRGTLVRRQFYSSMLNLRPTGHPGGPTGFSYGGCRPLLPTCCPYGTLPTCRLSTTPYLVPPGHFAFCPLPIAYCNCLLLSTNDYRLSTISLPHANFRWKKSRPGNQRSIETRRGTVRSRRQKTTSSCCDLDWKQRSE